MITRNLFSSVALAALVGTFASTLTQVASADQTIYVAGSSNEFGTLNLATGVFTQITTLNLPETDSIYGMGFGADGNLYGLDSQSNSHLFLISTTTGALSDLGTLGQSAIDMTSDATGKFYALDQNANSRLYKFNAPSLATSVVGPIGVESVGLAAITADGSVLYTSTFNGAGVFDLVAINTTTGASQDIGNLGFSVHNGLFVDGVLYGFDIDNNAIVTIDTTTGAGNQVATYSLPNQSSIFASSAPVTAAVPEPSSLALVLIGGIGWLARASRRYCKGVNR